MREVGWKRGVAWVVLACHLMVTFGLPLPSGQLKDASRPFPCQNRPCGCLTAEQCWKGDCCCFTLEQKLAWAEANGIEPPPHVRPLVESRKARRAPPRPKKKPCCTEADLSSAPPRSGPPTCCEQRQPAASACCEHVAGTEKKTPAADPAGVRWVVGLFAQKCRGEGPAGVFQFDPFASDLTLLALAAPERGCHLVPCSERTTSRTCSPLQRPPRCA